MLRVTFSLSLLSLLALAAGCDPAWSVRGAVVGPDGMVVAGATVVLECPGNSPVSRPVQTDAQGRFEFGGVGGATESARCDLVVTKTGFADERLPATRACHRSTSRGNYDAPCDPREELVALQLASP